MWLWLLRAAFWIARSQSGSSRCHEGVKRREQQHSLWRDIALFRVCSSAAKGCISEQNAHEEWLLLVGCRTVYSAVNSSIASGGPLRGSLFWEWNPISQPRDDRGVEIGDTAFT